MLTGFVSTFIAVSASVAAQSLSSSSPSVVCAAGQCLQGFSNLTIGAKLSAPGAATDIHLLPGQYFTNTNPQLLHNVLTTNGATLTPSAGFANANASSSSSTTALSLPLNLALQPGIATFTESLFGGQTAFIPVGNTSANSSTPLSALSLTLSANTFALVSSSSGSVRTVIWDPIPDIAQLPTSALSGSLSLLSLQSASCSPSCSGSATCSASGTCVCPTGFTGSSCESCAPGFFGPSCSACPADCDQCDDGISGTGRCLKNKVANEPATCGCLNGVCGSGGICACNEGWTTSANGTQCAKCAPGFFSTSNGDCKVCQLGCAQCADVSGDCINCKQSFTQSTLDPTTCSPPSTSTQTTSGTPCPSGSFSNGTACVACSPLCQTCTGATSNDCVVCGSGRVAFNGSCVSTDSNGVCEGTQLVADNNKRECDSCPAKCTTCGIPNFNVASTINQLQCTGCLPGFVLSNGQCINSCPSGTFLSPSDNLTCTACDSSCSTCAGSSTFCLTCSSGLLASAGKCASTCPPNTSPSSGSCISCHPDCATCTGGSFTQCASCPSSRPVLSNGRCLPTCAKNQFFDPTSGSCQSCDSSCASCSGSGPSSCLSCSNASGEVLRGGTCVAANCSSQTSVLTSLGVCLSDLIIVPQASASGTASTSLPPLSTISGLTNPTVVTNDNSSSGKLQWWQILLMTLGCAFIFLVFLMLWRRRARMQRKKRTEAFAAAKNLGGGSWRARLARFGEKFFGHRLGAAVLRRGGGNGGGSGGKNRGGGVEEYALPSYESDSSRLLRMRMEEQQRHEREMDTLLNAYEHSVVMPKSNDVSGNKTKLNKNAMNPSHLLPPRFHSSASSSSSSSHSTNHLSDASLYSQITGLPRRTAEPRRPIKDFTPPPVPIVPNSRFSTTTYEGSYYPPQAQLRARTPDRGDRDRSRAPTPAEEYAKSVITRSNSPQPQYPYQQQGSTPYYTAAQHQQLQQQRSLIDLDFDAPAPMLYPNNTGNTTVSRNPFRP